MEISCSFCSNFRSEPRNFAVLQTIGNLNFRSEFLEFSFVRIIVCFRQNSSKFNEFCLHYFLHSTVYNTGHVNVAKC